MTWLVPLRFIRIVKTYSPSSGKWWRTAMPPWLANGIRSSSRTSRRSNPVRYTCMTARLSGLPTAARLILVAAAM